MDDQLPAEDYAGPALVSMLAGARTSTTGPGGDASTSVEVDVTLRGHFEPLDGRFHWYGRIGAHDGLAALARAGDRVVLATPFGTTTGRLSDVDPWGRFRITGTGRPPFRRGEDHDGLGAPGRA